MNEKELRVQKLINDFFDANGIQLILIKDNEIITHVMTKVTQDKENNRFLYSVNADVVCPCGSHEDED